MSANTNLNPSSFNIETDIPSLQGKVILVTGGTAGLGEQSIKYLLRQNPDHIYFTGRNRDAAASLISTSKKINPNVPLTFIQLDMASLSSISLALQPFISKDSAQYIQRLDILIASAGVMAIPGMDQWTKDNFEAHFGINHLGTALIIRLLLPTLLATASLPRSDVRVVVLTSTGWRFHPKQGINFSSLRRDPDKHKIASTRVGNLSCMNRDLLNYGQSKLANILYVKQLSERYRNSGITAVAVHPGVVGTGLVGGLSWSWAWLVKLTSTTVTPEEGVRNQLWASVGHGVESGKWYLPVGIEGEEKYTKAADDELAKDLYRWTEEVFTELKVI